MANSWKPSQLSEIVDIHTGKVSVDEADLFTYISTDNLLPDFGGVVEAEKMPTSGKVTSYKVGDILFSNIRTYFKKLWLADQDGSCSNDVIVFRPKNGISSEYIYHLLMNQEFIEYTVKTSKGTKMPRGDKDAIMKYEFSLAPESEGLKIGNSLIQFKSKIELNRQTNQTLEQIAQALFKSWFVDFDPVFDNALASGMAVNDFPEVLQFKAEQRRQVQQKIASGELEAKPLPEEIRELFPSEFEQTDEPSIGINGWIPKGWEVSELAEVTIELRRGVSPKYTEEGGIQVINQKCIRNHEINFSLCRRNNPELRKVAGRELLIGDVLVNSTGVGTLGRVAQLHSLPEPTVVDSHVTVVRPNVEKVLTYNFGQLMLANELRIEALGEGSTGQTELSRKILSEQKVVIPPVNLVAKIEDTFKSYADKQVNNRVQIASLEKLRDTLLPKLISGELQLPAESINAEVSA